MHEQLVDHHCPVEGFIAVEAGCPCNWCDWVAPQQPPSGRPPVTTHKQGAQPMNKTIRNALAILAVSALAFAAHATPGNNGGGNGGCGVGQQTNGCGTPIPGPVGPQGPAGPMGPQGPQGEKGDKGDTGATGATGAQGIQGEKGDTGATGAQGVAGAKGDKGDTGAQGVAGADGKDGVDGKPGATGAQGKTGAAGANGSDATVPADVVRQAALNDAAAKLNSRLDSMQGQIDRNDRRAAAGVSAAIAFASMPQTIEPGSVSITAGVGSYDSEAGLAMGVSGRDVSGNFTWKAGVTVGSRGTAGVGAGAAWRFK